MESVTHESHEQQKHLEVRREETAVKQQAVQRALDSLIQVQLDTPENEAVKDRYRNLVEFVEELRMDPMLLLTQPGPQLTQNGYELPDWIHQRFQMDGTQEEIMARPPKELRRHSKLYSKFLLDATDMNKMFVTQNGLQRKLLELIRRNARGSHPFVRVADLVFHLYETLSKQASLNYSLVKAHQAIQEFAPRFAVQQQVSAFFSPFHYSLEAGAYVGKTKDRHYLIANYGDIALNDLNRDDAPYQLREMISLMEHELIHAKQAELIENQVIASGGQMNPMNLINETSTELLARLSTTERRSDDSDIILLLWEQERAYRQQHHESFLLFRTLAEGPAILGEIYLLQRRRLQVKDPIEKKMWNDFLLQNLRGLQSKEAEDICPHYMQGRRIFDALQREFGSEKLPELFRQIDFQTILRTNSAPELLRTILQDPRLIPGLSRVPEIQESLQKRPPASSV